MSPRTSKQFEKMRDSRRRQIMDSALELFAGEGYSHTSMAKLALHAGISKGLVYNYFDSKEALLGEIIEEGIAGMFNMITELPDKGPAKLGPKELERFIRQIFKEIRGDVRFWKLYMGVAMQPKVMEVLEGKPFMSIMDTFAPMVMDYFTRNGFDDPELEMLMLSSLMEGMGAVLVFYDSYPLSDELMQRFEDRVIKLFTKDEKN